MAVYDLPKILLPFREIVFHKAWCEYRKEEVGSLPKVSIIVLTYNNFENLKRNIDSILIQTYSDYEVIIQDDGSHNFNEEWIMSLIPVENQAAFKINHLNSNKGTVINYNSALRITNGEIIVPLAQDDFFYDEGSLLSIVNAMEKKGSCICTSKRIGEKDNIVYPCKEDCSILKEGGDSLFQRLLFMNFISGSVTYYSRAYLFETNCFDEQYKLLEDYPKILEAVEKKVSISFLDKITIVYGQNGVVGGKQKKESVASQQLKVDCLLNYKSNILPNMDIIHSKKIKRYIKYHYESIMSEKLWNKIWIRIINLDFYLLGKFINHKDINIDFFPYIYKLLSNAEGGE